MKRMKPDERRKVILEAALKLSKERGLCGWQRSDLAATCSPPTSFDTTKHYFRDMTKLREAVAAHPKAGVVLKNQCQEMLASIERRKS